MTSFIHRFALLIAVSLFASQLLMAQETPRDKEIRTAYAKIETARSAMAGDMKDEERRSKMENFRNTALAFVQKYGNSEGRLVTGHFDLGRAYIDLQDTAQAATRFERFLAVAPKSPSAPKAALFLGDCYRSLNRLKDAITLYRGFVAKYPGAEERPFARLGLATSHYLDLDFDSAISVYKEVIANHAAHQVAGDASFQLVDALVNDGRYGEARKHIDGLLAEAKEAPELLARKKLVDLLGRPAKELVGVKKWIGRKPTTLARNQGRVVVLCFFMNNNVPSTQMLQHLSDLSAEANGRPVTFWGLTKAYKANKHRDWSFDTEARWLARYRKDPRFVLQRELRTSPKGDEEQALWSRLEKPITIPLVLTEGFENHRALGVRGVPAVIVIDKKGIVRMIEQGGQPVGGFQSRLLEKTVMRLSAE